MKTLYILITGATTLIVILALVGNASALEQEMIDRIAERRTEFLTEQLDLSDDQQANIEAIFNEMHSIEACSELEWEEKIDCIQGVRTQIQELIKAELDAEQLEAYEELLSSFEDFRESRKAQRFSGRSNKPRNVANFLSRKISDLTDEQQEQINDIASTAKEEFDCSELSGEEKQECKSELREELLAAVRPILTEAQQEELDDLIARFNNRARRQSFDGGSRFGGRFRGGFGGRF